jgi:hypothetical protein
MTGKFVYAFCIFVVCLAIVSCKKLESDNPKMTGPLAYEPVKFANAIPDEYGALVGVTQNSQRPKWVELWFQKSDKTITAVLVNIDEGTIYEKALTIPRK